MEPLRQHHDAFAVTGHTVRTTNREENDPKTARIGTLWGRFFADPQLQDTRRSAATLRTTTASTPITNPLRTAPST